MSTGYVCQTSQRETQCLRPTSQITLRLHKQVSFKMMTYIGYEIPDIALPVITYRLQWRRN